MKGKLKSVELKGMKFDGKNFKEIKEFSDDEVIFGVWDNFSEEFIHIEKNDYIAFNTLSNIEIFNNNRANTFGFNIKEKENNIIEITHERDVDIIQWTGDNFKDIFNIFKDKYSVYKNDIDNTLCILVARGSIYNKIVKLNQYIVFDGIVYVFDEDELYKRYNIIQK